MHDPVGALNGTADGRKVVGALKCQQDTYLTSLVTSVCQCDRNGKVKGDEAYEIQFLDTILFPEGGGQPWDHGQITAKDTPSIPIKKVVRRKLEAIHYSPTPLPVGTEVNIELDWQRRFDHAQQHTGQHLLSAVLDQYNIPTLAWTMGPEIVYVEVPRLPEHLQEVEEKCNAYIRQDLPVKVTLTQDRPVNLPADYDASNGVIRVVSIGDIDANPCCGTHLSSIGQLNSLTILFTSTVRASNHRIHFVLGKRCQKQLREVYSMAKLAASSLSTQIEDIPGKVTALQVQMKDLMKRERLLKAEIIAFEAEKLKIDLSQRGQAFLHRSLGDIEMLNAILSAIPNLSDGLLVMIAGEKDGGPIIVAGPDEKVMVATSIIKAKFPHIKGGGRPGKFQGKSTGFSKDDLILLRTLGAS